MKGNPGWIVGVCNAACLAGIAAALHAWGAIEVRSNPGAVVALTIAGAFWILLPSQTFPWFGLSFELDVVENRNVPATLTICSAMTALALLYVGGSLGEGPSYAENFFSAGLATITWLVLWLILELSATVSVSITEERDLASGLRMSGYLIACGLVLSRAVAGNWVSVPATIGDFIHDGWPAVALTALTVPIEWRAKPSRSRPFPSWKNWGMIPALAYLAAAGAWGWYLGRWEGMP